MATITPSVAGGNWSSTLSWTGGAVPGSGDDVVFHAGAGNITVDGTSGSPSLCRSLDLATFVYAGTLTMGATAVLNIGDGSGGSYTMYSGATFAPNAAAVINFVSTTSGNQLKFGGKTTPSMVFNGAGGVWQYQDAPATGTNIVTLTAGSLDWNNKSFSIGGFNSNNSNTRALTIGTGTITCGNAPSHWNITTSTAMTLSAASSTIATSSTSSGLVFNGGGLTYGTYSSSGITTGSLSINQANTFGTLTLGNGAQNSTSYNINADQIVTGTFTCTGNSVINRIALHSGTRGTPFTITAATVSVTHVDIEDITGAGAGSWNLSATARDAGDCGGNSGITFAAPKNCYLKTAVSVNWSASNWFTASGGSTPIANNVPLVQDNTFLDANSVTAAGKTITLNMQKYPSINCTGVLNSPVLAFTSGISTNLSFYGDFILDSGGMTTANGKVNTFFGRRGSNNINGAGVTITAATAFDCLTGTYTFTGDVVNNNAGNNSNLISGTVAGSSYSYTTGGAITATTGTFSFLGLTQTAGNLTHTSGSLTFGASGYSGANISGSNSNARTLAINGPITLSGTGTVWNFATVTGLTFSANSSTIAITDTSATTKTFAGGGLTYNNLTISGAASNGTITISGADTFATVTINPDASIIWTKTTTYTMTTLSCSGTSGHKVTFATNTGGSPATLNVSSPVNADYMNIKDSTAANNTPFYAGTNSTDNGGNTNWTFTARPSGSVVMIFDMF